MNERARTVLDSKVVDLLTTSSGHRRTGRVGTDGDDVEQLGALLVWPSGLPCREDVLEVVAPESLTVHLDGNSCAASSCKQRKLGNLKRGNAPRQPRLVHIEMALRIGSTSARAEEDEKRTD